MPTKNEVTGWQNDGSYVPCPECGCEPEKRRNEPPGVAIHMPGTIHYDDCPLVPHLSPEVERELREQLDEMDRCRRRAEVESRNYFVG